LAVLLAFAGVRDELGLMKTAEDPATSLVAGKIERTLLLVGPNFSSCRIYAEPASSS
jgi:hypothetical protein